VVRFLARCQTDGSHLQALNYMGEPLTPRGTLKALLRGETPQRPLLMPIIFSLGSRLENLPLREFQSNPTKIANALRQIRAVLKVDGVACYFDPFLEAEALGCRVEWLPDGSQRVTPPPYTDVDELLQKLKTPDSICEKGRGRAGCEVLQRLKAMLRDEPALMVRVTGPLTLAAQLLSPGDLDTPASVPSSLIECAAEVTACVAKEFVAAGADAIFLTEDFLPDLPDENYQHWAALLEPVINLVRFYDCLPVLLLEDPARVGAVLPGLLQGHGCLVGRLGTPERKPEAGDWRATASLRGLALPNNLFAERADDGCMSAACAAIRGLRPMLLTTTADIPMTADLKQVATALKSLREACAEPEQGLRR